MNNISFFKKFKAKIIKERDRRYINKKIENTQLNYKIATMKNDEKDNGLFYKPIKICIILTLLYLIYLFIDNHIFESKNLLNDDILMYIEDTIGCLWICTILVLFYFIIFITKLIRLFNVDYYYIKRLTKGDHTATKKWIFEKIILTIIAIIISIGVFVFLYLNSTLYNNNKMLSAIVNSFFYILILIYYIIISKNEYTRNDTTFEEFKNRYFYEPYKGSRKI